MDGAGAPELDVGIVVLLVGALTGQHELSEADRQAVGDWMIDHANEAGVRDLLIKVVRTQIGDTSEFRVKVAEAIRDRFRSAPTDVTTDQSR
jgi:tetrahydromethanopterin S-methyltransferase subunit H